MKFTEKTAELRERTRHADFWRYHLSIWIQPYLKPSTPRCFSYKHQSMIFFWRSRGMVKEFGWVSFTRKNISLESLYEHIFKAFITGYATIPQLLLQCSGTEGFGKIWRYPSGMPRFSKYISQASARDPHKLTRINPAPHKYFKYLCRIIPFLSSPLINLSIMIINRFLSTCLARLQGQDSSDLFIRASHRAWQMVNAQ